VPQDYHVAFPMPLPVIAWVEILQQERVGLVCVTGGVANPVVVGDVDAARDEAGAAGLDAEGRGNSFAGSEIRVAEYLDVPPTQPVEERDLGDRLVALDLQRELDLVREIDLMGGGQQANRLLRLRTEGDVSSTQRRESDDDADS